MKAQLIGRKFNRGFATLEILIAFAVLILCIGAVIMVSFGNQSIAVDSQINNEAITRAKKLLEDARANSRFDFNLVNPSSTTEISGGVTFTKELDVTQTDLFTKKVVSTVTWQTTGRTLQTLLTTLLTNPDAVNGGDTCSSVLSGDWKNPQMTSLEFGKDLLGDPSSDFLINGIDVYNNKMYIAADITHGNNKNTFFVFNLFPDPTSPSLVDQIDNNPNPAVQTGLNSMRIFENYAYAANAVGSNFDTCVNGTCGQLQVIDISVTPAVPKLLFKVPGVVGKNGQSIGTSIFYKDNYIYLGLAKTSSGPEFNVIDVQNPLNPIYKGGYSVGNAVNAIFVKDNYAYIATPNSENITIVNVDVDSANFMQRVGGYSPSGGSNGKSVSVVGSTVYLGRTFGSNEFYALNAANPSNVSEFGKKDIGSGSSTSINGLIVRDYLAFFITGNNFQVWKLNKTTNPWTTTPWSSPLPFPTQGGGNSPGTATDCEGNYFYVGSLPSGNLKGSVSIIGPGP